MKNLQNKNNLTYELFSYQLNPGLQQPLMYFLNILTESYNIEFHGGVYFTITSVILCKKKS